MSISYCVWSWTYSKGSCLSLGVGPIKFKIRTIWKRNDFHVRSLIVLWLEKYLCMYFNWASLSLKFTKRFIGLSREEGSKESVRYWFDFDVKLFSPRKSLFLVFFSVLWIFQSISFACHERRKKFYLFFILVTKL